MKEGTRSGLWSSMCEAIEVIRPKLVVWENVRGALSAEADSGVEPCPVCVGEIGPKGKSLRALGRVLGDLAEIGYDSRVYGLRAADVGAPHNRYRIFVFATPSNTSSGSLQRAALLRDGLSVTTQRRSQSVGNTVYQGLQGLRQGSTAAGVSTTGTSRSTGASTSYASSQRYGGGAKPSSSGTTGLLR